MFHQANIIPADDLGGKSALAYWYEQVMATFHTYITFPVKVCLSKYMASDIRFRSTINVIAGLAYWSRLIPPCEDTNVEGNKQPLRLVLDRP